jgi:ribonuclease HII
VNHLFAFDRTFSYITVAGTDEAGRGPLAGPVTGAAVILDPKAEESLMGLNDSKKLSPRRREQLFPLIQKHALDYSIVFIEHDEIDRINILQASLQAMRRALSQLKIKPDGILIDGNQTVPGIEKEKQRTIIKGDGKSACIAAASILAKVARDKKMMEYHELYPCYEFARHKGYGTALHIERLKQYGPCPIHRKSFCKKILEENVA